MPCRNLATEWSQQGHEMTLDLSRLARQNLDFDGRGNLPPVVDGHTNVGFSLTPADGLTAPMRHHERSKCNPGKRNHVSRMRPLGRRSDANRCVSVVLRVHRLQNHFEAIAGGLLCLLFLRNRCLPAHPRGKCLLRVMNDLGSERQYGRLSYAPSPKAGIAKT